VSPYHTPANVISKPIEVITQMLKIRTLVLVASLFPIIAKGAEPRPYESTFAGSYSLFEDPSANPWLVRESISYLKNPLLLQDTFGNKLGPLVSDMIVSDTVVMKSFKGLRLGLKTPVIGMAQGPSVGFRELTLPGFKENLVPVNPTGQVAWASRRGSWNYMVGANISFPELNSKPWSPDSVLDVRPFVNLVRPGNLTVGAGVSGSVVYEPWTNLRTTFMVSHSLGAFRYGVESQHGWAISSHLVGPSVGVKTAQSRYFVTYLKQVGRADNTPDYAVNLIIQKSFGSDPVDRELDVKSIVAQVTPVISDEAKSLISSTLKAGPLVVESTEAFKALEQAHQAAQMAQAVESLKTPEPEPEVVATSIVPLEDKVPPVPTDGFIPPPANIEADVKPEIPEAVLADSEKKAEVIKEEEPRIVFRFKNSTLMPTPKTEEILGAVAATLSVHTEIKKLMVSAYFYSSGMDSFRLAERRAREVVKYLVKSGVDRKRLTVRAIYRNRTDVDPRTTHMYFQVVE